MAGVKFGSALKELRILLCQTSNSSAGVREFIQNHYVSMKKSNPKFPILIRECSSIEPKVYARYEFGNECCVPLKDLKSEEILQKVQQLASSKA